LVLSFYGKHNVVKKQILSYIDYMPRKLQDINRKFPIKTIKTISLVFLSIILVFFLALFFTGCDNSNAKKTNNSETQREPSEKKPDEPKKPVEPDAAYDPAKQKATTITSFKFLKENTGTTSDLNGVINHNNRTITFTTQAWINNIESLPAVFTLNDAGFPYVNEKRQHSGVTKNDFRREVVYLINKNISYIVKFVSPQASGLPVIRIDTDNSAPVANRETWVGMTFSLSDPSNSLYDIPAIKNQQIRGRGNASWSDTPGAKNPYRIRFRDNQQQSPFGLPHARNWVLLKCGTDLNTSFGFELGRRLKLDYTCSYNYVQLYLNGDYRGMYIFTEHRQADPAERGAPGRPKVDLREGWFVEIDRRYDEEPRFRTNNFNLPVMIKTPEDDSDLSMSNPIYQFVRDDWNEITGLMASDSFPENGYRNLVHLDSFVKYFIVQTLIKNNDLFRPGAEIGLEIGSTYFYKDKGRRIYAGPLWDLDWSFAPWEFEGELFLPDTAPYQIHPWFRRFHDDPVFQARYKEIWNNNLQNNILTMSAFIDTMGAKIREGVLEDMKRWSEGNIDWHIGHIKSYFSTRAAYLNAEYNKVDVLPERGNFSPASAQRKITLAAFGEMTDLSAALQNGSASVFEIDTPLAQSPTGAGGYLAAVTIKVKTPLPAGARTDRLVLTGKNQGKTFAHNVVLSYSP